MVRMSSQGLFSSWSKLSRQNYRSADNIPSSRLVAFGSPRMATYKRPGWSQLLCRKKSGWALLRVKNYFFFFLNRIFYVKIFGRCFQSTRLALFTQMSTCFTWQCRDLERISNSQPKFKIDPTVLAIACVTYSVKHAVKFGIPFVSMYWLVSKTRSLDVTGNSWLSSPLLLYLHLVLRSRLPGLTCNLNKAVRRSHICWFWGANEFDQPLI